jgi:hypothetical protein
MWGGLSAGSRPLGGFVADDETSLLEAGCRLIARPTIGNALLRVFRQRNLLDDLQSKRVEAYHLARMIR